MYAMKFGSKVAKNVTKKAEKATTGPVKVFCVPEVPMGFKVSLK
jgi:hypothetical protein